MGVLNSDVWPTTEDQRRLVAREERHKNMIKRKISLKISNKGNHLVPEPGVNAEALPTALELPKAAMTTKRINKARIVTVSNQGAPMSAPTTT